MNLLLLSEVCGHVEALPSRKRSLSASAIQSGETEIKKNNLSKERRLDVMQKMDGITALLKAAQRIEKIANGTAPILLSDYLMSSNTTLFETESQSQEHSHSLQLKALDLDKSGLMIQVDSSSMTLHSSSTGTSTSLHESQFSSLAEYLDAVAEAIPKKGPFVCPLNGCDKAFKRKDNLKCHLKVHNPNRERPFACSDCDETYLRRVDLKRHIETVHEQATRHPCSKCNRTFTRKEGLYQHMRRH